MVCSNGSGTYDIRLMRTTKPFPRACARGYRRAIAEASRGIAR